VKTINKRRILAGKHLGKNLLEKLRLKKKKKLNYILQEPHMEMVSSTQWSMTWEFYL
jgi:hypothetical protein